MKTKEELKKAAHETGNLAGAIGRGLLAGLAGAAAMTISQMIEMQITKREPSNTPANGVDKVLPVNAPENEEEKAKLSKMTHFIYGTVWGAPLGILNFSGLKGIQASTIHLAAVWGTAAIMLPKLNLAPPVNKWSKKQIAVDLLHHSVYALAAGLTYAAISKKHKTGTHEAQIREEVYKHTSNQRQILAETDFR